MLSSLPRAGQEPHRLLFVPSGRAKGRGDPAQPARSEQSSSPLLQEPPAPGAGNALPRARPLRAQCCQITSREGQSVPCAGLGRAQPPCQRRQLLLCTKPPPMAVPAFQSLRV